MHDHALIKMGIVGRPHGIKGELGLDWHGDYIPKKGDTIFLQKADSSPAPFVITKARLHKNKLLLTLQGIATRTDAEALVGASALLPKTSLPQPEEGEAFLADLLGSRIYLPDNTYLGTLDHLEFPAGQMIWSIHTPGGREILFPANPEFIVALDTQQKTAIIAPPAGLLDIYNA